MKKKYIALNIIIAVFAGALLYYAAAPDVKFVTALDKLLQIKRNVPPELMNNRILAFVINYVPDIMWSYALIFSVLYIFGSEASDIRKAFVVSAIFSVIVEMLQLTPVMKGTFDVFDILAELSAQIFAVFIMNIMKKRGKGYEKV